MSEFFAYFAPFLDLHDRARGGRISFVVCMTLDVIVRFIIVALATAVVFAVAWKVFVA